jgi:UDP-N-acetylmuramoylalanine--D-glutamate ligase
MIPLTVCRGKRFGVFGLARSGLATIAALKAGGATSLAWDDDAKKREIAQSMGAEIAPIADWPWAEIAALVLSPGVPLTHPEPHAVVKAAKKADVPVIGDMELFACEMQSRPDRPRIVAITGTNGKSTTTALTAHLLKTAGLAVQMGGNIGRPVLDLEPLGPSGVYVLELSSFQIDLAPALKPNVAILLNITPDHIDRHGTMAGYVAVKRRIFKPLGREGTAVIGVDDPYSAEICTAVSSNGVGRTIPISIGKAIDRGISVIDGVLYDRCQIQTAEILDLRRARALPGRHNWQNAAAAFAAARVLSNDVQALIRGLISFPGLPHRMEDVGRIGKIRCINDSKATNADAAAKALGCFENIYWIAGGVAKEGGIESLEPYFPRIAQAYLIGQSAPLFAKTLDGKVPCTGAVDLARALDCALADARASDAPNPVILLSPACASFDQFRDYEDRGDQFRAAVAGRRDAAHSGHAA